MIKKIVKENEFEDRLKKRVEDLKSLVESFNNEARSLGSIVYLDLKIDGYHPDGVFEIKFNINDPLVDSKNYNAGHAYIYPSDRVENMINQFARSLGYSVSWNNTGTTGWLSFK